MVTTGAKIKKLREVRGYSQSYMAAKLHISQEQYSYLENKQKNISDKNVKMICVLLNVPTDYLENFEPTQLIENDVFVEKKIMLKDFLGKKNMTEQEAYFDLIVWLKAEISELKKEIKDLKSAFLREDKEP